MTVDNSAKIGTMLSFREDDFYFIQVIKRRKDNPEMERGEIILKNYYINSIEQYIKVVPKIIQLCNMENARAYIRVNRRNYKKLAHPMLKLVVEYISGGQYKSMPNAFDAVVGRNDSEPDKHWVIDIDWVDMTTNEVDAVNVLCFIESEIKKTGRDNTVEILPTKNGVHYISRPFNVKVFKDKYPFIIVGKDACTLMYCP